MDLADVYPELDSGLKLIKNNEPQLAAYLSDPDVECTFFAPTNQVRAALGGPRHVDRRATHSEVR